MRWRSDGGHEPVIAAWRRLVAVAGTLLASTAAVQAVENWMGEAELTATLSGKTIQGHYASGRPFTESYGADGSIDYREPDRVSAGHWSIQNGAFCTIYKNDSAGGCYRVRQVSENCYEFYFVARTEFDAATDNTIRPSWTARAAVSDRTSSCDDRPAV